MRVNFKSLPLNVRQFILLVVAGLFIIVGLLLLFGEQLEEFNILVFLGAKAIGFALIFTVFYVLGRVLPRD